MTAPKSGNSRGPDACRGRRPKFEWTRRRFGRSSVLFATALARAPGISPQKSRTNNEASAIAHLPAEPERMLLQPAKYFAPTTREWTAGPDVGHHRCDSA